jgi:hypothetical protein
LERYEYKESVLNPKNPLHRTTEWEVELIRSFREQPDLKMIIGDRKTHSENSDKKNN